MPRHVYLMWGLLAAVVVLVIHSMKTGKVFGFPQHPITQGMGPWPSLGTGVAYRPFGYSEPVQNTPS